MQQNARPARPLPQGCFTPLLLFEVRPAGHSLCDTVHAGEMTYGGPAAPCCMTVVDCSLSLLSGRLPRLILIDFKCYL